MLRDLAIITIIALGLIGWLGLKTRAPAPAIEPISLANVLGEAPDHFRRVTGPEAVVFPRDHAAHPEYRNEWWYFTGNLTGPDGQALGFQFTLFRFAQGPGAPVDSDWTSDQLWMAHLALSDIDSARFFQAERFSREALGLAGATESRWWLRDWQIVATEDGWRLDAATHDFELDLTLDLVRPIVLQGDQGYSRKGPEPGNASRYYSATRLATEGRVRMGDHWLEVEGLSWLDREWGSGQLAEDVQGWDWFALHLDDGRDLMIYRLRHPDGSASSWSAGILVDADGSSRTLNASDFNAMELSVWKDGQGVSWPLAWSLDVPSAQLSLTVRAAFNEQRWTRSVPYWEGSVIVSRTDDDQQVGQGYLELSGYADQ